MDQDKKDLKCGFCKRGKEVEPQCGQLWHDELQKCTAHKKCMVRMQNFQTIVHSLVISHSLLLSVRWETEKHLPHLIPA